MEFDQANKDVSQALMEITDHPQDWLDRYA